MTLQNNTKVVLVSFSGQALPPADVRADENYWKLIGEEGRVIDDQSPDWTPAENPKALILFSVPLDEFGLANHNLITNTLWVSLSDLRRA